jgi:hypothetical protein
MSDRVLELIKDVTYDLEDLEYRYAYCRFNAMLYGNKSCDKCLLGTDPFLCYNYDVLRKVI